MYVRIRPTNFVEDKSDFILHVRKNTYISEIYENVFKKWSCPGYRPRLIYMGKELSPHCRIINYDIQVNDVILVTFTVINGKRNMCPNMVDVDSKFYKPGDLVDVRCDTYFAWWAGIIVAIKKHESTVLTQDMSNETVERKFSFIVRFDKEDERDQFYVTSFDSIRPRSIRVVTFNELKKNDIVLIQHRWLACMGFWYDLHIVNLDAKVEVITGTLTFDPVLPAVTNVNFFYNDGRLELYKVRKHELLSLSEHVEGSSEVECEDCDGDRCRSCGCYLCAGKNDPGAIVLCDECDKGYHYYCLDPPLPVVPIETEWYCPNCINIPNIIVVGRIPEIDETAMIRKCAIYEDNKIWGRGMACVGRSTECTIVPKHHFGPIPGVDVGVRWKFRIQVSEAGVHRPPVAGIHGRDTDGAYSLVMSGGYVDDEDKGTEFIYSGSGGRDLSGNKRVADQSKDQVLTRNNKALALNCYAKFNAETGAKSENWKKGKPVRVCRSSKFAPFSKYAPKEGIRYDGLYKVVKYYKEVGVSGFFVWKYLLKRDDPTPAPWQKGGQEYDIIYPAGYLEAHKINLSTNGESSKEVSCLSNKDKTKDQKAETSVPVIGQNVKGKGKGKSTKKSFKLEPDIEKLIKSDTLNIKLWEECATFIKLGKFQYTAKVQETFKCIVCQEVVFNPITTKCKHNTCKECLKKSFEADIFQCPYCRNQLGPNYRFQINKKLAHILLRLLPGYGQYR